MTEPTSSVALVLVGKKRKETWCRFCERWIDNRGYQSHVHFRHLGAYLDDFRFTMRRLFLKEFGHDLRTELERTD